MTKLTPRVHVDGYDDDDSCNRGDDRKDGDVEDDYDDYVDRNICYYIKYYNGGDDKEGVAV